MISASNSCLPVARTRIGSSPRTRWKTVRISPFSPITTPEPKSPGSEDVGLGLGIPESEAADSNGVVADRRATVLAADRRRLVVPRADSRAIATTEGSALAIASASAVSMPRRRPAASWAAAGDRPGPGGREPGARCGIVDHLGHLSMPRSRPGGLFSLDLSRKRPFGTVYLIPGMARTRGNRIPVASRGKPR